MGRSVICLLVVMVLCVVAGAEAIIISPIPVEFRVKDKVVALKLEPTEDAEKDKVFEAKVVKWDVKTGEYQDTNDLVVYPTATKLPGNFKIALRGQVDRGTEKTYRIVVKDITKKDEGISFFMSYDLPIFILPKGGESKVDVQCGSTIKVKNTGNRTVKVSEVDGQGVVMYIAIGDEKEVTGKSVKINDKEYCN